MCQNKILSPHCGSIDETGKCSAGVGEDDFAVRRGAQPAAGDEINGSAARFVQKIEDGLRQIWIDQSCINRLGGVDEHDDFSAVELVPEPRKIRVSEIVVVGPVAGEHCHAVSAEDVERMYELLECDFFIQERRQGGEEAEGRRVVVMKFSRVLVALPSEEGCCYAICLDWRTG